MPENKIHPYLAQLGVVGVGHIEVSTPRGIRHVPHWADTGTLATAPAQLRTLARMMAEQMLSILGSDRRTTIVTHDNYAANMFGGMLAAELETVLTNGRLTTATIQVVDRRRTITNGIRHYTAAERIIVADIAAYSMETLQYLLAGVVSDRQFEKRALPELLAVTLLRLGNTHRAPEIGVRGRADPVRLIIGSDIPTQEYSPPGYCPLCKDGKALTHTISNTTGLKSL